MFAVFNVELEEIWSRAYVELLDASNECWRQEKEYDWEFKVVRVEGPANTWWRR